MTRLPRLTDALPCALRGALTLALVLLVPASSFSQVGPSARQQQRGTQDVIAVNFQRPAREVLADHRAIERALAALKPQRAGVVDAYVVVAALDIDPVFRREAGEAGRVLARRFGADGRTIVLGGERDGSAPGSPAHLAMALARAAELMDRDEDVLILSTTSHGSAQTGLAYRDQARGVGAIAPRHLAAMLDDAGISNRLVLISACYSGVFIPALASDRSIVVTAAASDRSSFGCSPGNDWTFFGDALINRALRKPQPLGKAFEEAAALVSTWEAAGKLVASNPQISTGDRTKSWLAALEKRMPRTATEPVGRSPAPVPAASPAPVSK